MKNSRIIIIGFMGCGKTYSAKFLSEKLLLPFYDLDFEIQKAEKISINDIFKFKGEKYFRQVESDLLLDLNENCIVATGGGIIEEKINRNFLKRQENFVIWLNPEWDIIYNRIKNSQRPLVQKLNEDQLYALWQKRIKLYQECADITISGINDTNIKELLFQKYYHLKNVLNKE
jgi:shikimate kinase